MGLFDFSKKKNAEEASERSSGGGASKTTEPTAKKAAVKVKSSACCGEGCNAETMTAAEKAKSCGAYVKVLGSGCAKCNALEAAAKEALAELGMDTSIDHVSDFSQIAAYGVMSTPALVVDGKVLSYGKVLKKDEIKAILIKLEQKDGLRHE